MSMELQRLPISDLLGLYAHVVEELRRRGVTRSSNNPVADYAEYLCERALSLTRTETSAKGFDATDSAGTRYQIKAADSRHAYDMMHNKLFPAIIMAMASMPLLAAVPGEQPPVPDMRMPEQKPAKPSTPPAYTASRGQLLY